VNLAPVLVVAITCLALLSGRPASAAPREIEDFCLEQLQHATLAHRRGAGEAFMANCIADLTPMPTPGRKGPLTEDGNVIPRPKGKPHK
jgi:hypothetical protein